MFPTNQPKTKIIYPKGLKPFKGRVYREQDGNYMSVTSIIHPEGIDFPEDKLRQYAARGTVVHSIVEHYLNTNEWITADQCEKTQEVNIVRTGSLGLPIEACNAKGFFEEYGEDLWIRYVEKKLKNHTHKYAGTADMIGKYKGIWSIIDIKTASNYDDEKLTSYWMQLSAYAKCVTNRIPQMVIIPLNPTSPKGYDAPIVSRAVEGNFKKFLKQLKYVRETYQVPSV